MHIKIRFFASMRERLGMGEELLNVPETVETVGDLRALLSSRGGVWAEVLAEGRALRMAHNQVMAEAGTPIADGSEVAFFPPVTGG